MSVDMVKLEEYMNSLQSSVSEFDSITEKIISENSADLDSLMTDLRVAVTQEEAASTDTIERYYAELSNLLYFMADRLERLSVYRDMGKAKNKEAYNKAYLSFSAEKDEKGKSVRTVNENTALAETESQYDSTINLIYSSVYDAVKLKVDMAQEMVNTLKNILKKRISENYLNAQLSSMRGGMGELRGEDFNG